MLLNATVPVGEAASVRVVVNNSGAATGTRTLSLRANGVVVERRTVTVPANESRTVSFAFVPERAGRFSIGMGNTSVGTLRATSETTSTTTTTASGGVPGFGPLAAFAVLLVGITVRRQ
jgi:hypothetical protein